MTYTEFKNKYNSKKVDYDGAYGAQCWDLGQYYFTKVLGLPASVLSGCGLVSNMLKGKKFELMKKYFDIIPKDKIQQGDVVIWNYGHIAIFDSKKNGVNYYFSQNPNAPKVMTINNNTYTVFRLKSKSTSNASSSNQNSNSKPNTSTAYYPKSNYKGTSIVTALAQLNVNHSYSYRAKIAAKNGITGYRGTAVQNTKMLNLLKQGKLRKV